MEFVEFALHLLELAIFSLVESWIGETLGKFRLLGLEFFEFARQLIEFTLLAIEELPSLLDFDPLLRDGRNRGCDGGFHLRGLSDLTLADPILVAAGVFGKASIPLVDDGAGHDIVEEGAVVGDEQERSLVVHKQFLEQFEGLCIEVVRRFVEYKHIGWLEEEAGKQEAVALSSREHLGRHADTVRGKEKVAQVAMDVARPALEGDGLGLSGDVPADAFLTVDLVAELIEVDDLKLGAEFHRALLRLEAP